ncbi:MAG: hypothetical protein GW762_03270 [Candidatus Pacebacteria bacterium]|nr:hypothetical protein [Candidatus Paceibacterota bacterium]PIR63522.1 MAG: hypothetical protein COU64_04040 [Candidatus Pacebacteria bacterium CG10_big_fil_rev_8_21_14_0_10_40_26]PIZ79415.1 MAG: hypothetical protein COY01_01040 [Candidatus Pacebacteria bacterium CG_4_10_14_0_2_um_filter_40_20]PJA68556.1 MAG: hypothetical protein CO156_04670 [Candidatus Pacebacteria bacterium CG_4_9_14_3_um_filter_40_12]PJC41940.1 MAG: hypothetical protein CO041_01925 [Candidatus Pacebacteria bacterium CG_4_9_
MKNIVSLFVAALFSGLFLITPVSAHASAYNVYNPSSGSIEITCEVSDATCGISEPVTFLNVSGQMLFETSMWTEGQNIKYSSTSNGYTSERTMLDWPSVIEPNHTVGTAVVFTNPQVVGTHQGRLLIDGKVCNRNVTPWDCYYAGGSALTITMHVVNSVVPTPSPSPSPSILPTPTPSPTPAATPVVTPSPTPSPSPSPSPIASPSPSPVSNEAGGIDDSGSDSSSGDSSSESSSESTDTTDADAEVKTPEKAQSTVGKVLSKVFDVFAPKANAEESLVDQTTPEAAQATQVETAEQELTTTNSQYVLLVVLILAVVAGFGGYYAHVSGKLQQLKQYLLSLKK